MEDFKSTIEWYNENASDYSEVTETSGVPKQLINRFAATLEGGDRVADLGCAGGRDTIALQRTGLNVVGVDLSEGLIEEAQKRHPECEFLQGDLRKLPSKTKN